MADFLAPIKSAISSGDKAVSALQSGNQGYFADAVRDGLLALTALASVVSNNPLLRGTNALGSMYGLKKSADDLYAAGNLPEALRATAGALAAVGSLMAAFPAPQAKIVGAILAITFTAVKRGIEAYIATNDPTVLQSPTNAFPPYSQSEFYQFEVTPIDFFASISPATNTITGDQAQPDHFDVLYGSGAGDDITGLDGNDALSGGAGTDVISGGVGDDLIGGGAGSDVIKGGAGNDWIFSAVDLTAPARTGSSDVWPPIGQPLPATATILSQGMTWGIYNDLQPDGQRAIVINYLAAGTPDDAPDVIDGGDGDDYVVAGRGADYIEGGLGNDGIFGGAGGDIIDGGAGNDQIVGGGGNGCLDGYHHRQSRHIKNNSKLNPFHVGYGSIKFIKRLGQSQYTRNGYIGGQFSESTDSGNASTHSKGMPC